MFWVEMSEVEYIATEANHSLTTISEPLNKTVRPFVN